MFISFYQQIIPDSNSNPNIVLDVQKGPNLRYTDANQIPQMLRHKEIRGDHPGLLFDGKDKVES